MDHYMDSYDYGSASEEWYVEYMTGYQCCTYEFVFKLRRTLFWYPACPPGLYSAVQWLIDTVEGLSSHPNVQAPLDSRDKGRRLTSKLRRSSVRRLVGRWET